MITIGITGGVGAGKSTVLDFLAEKYQAYVMKADEIGHLVMEPGQECYEPVIALFGKQIIKDDKTIDRRQVSDVVFSHPDMLERLNEIIHPAGKKVYPQAAGIKKTAGTEDLCSGGCTSSGRSLSGILRYHMVYPHRSGDQDQKTDGEPGIYQGEIHKYHCQSGTGRIFPGKCRLCGGK